MLCVCVVFKDSICKGLSICVLLPDVFSIFRYMDRPYVIYPVPCLGTGFFSPIKECCTNILIYILEQVFFAG